MTMSSMPPCRASAVIMAPDDVERLEETIAVLAEGRVEDLDALAVAMRARRAGA